MSKILKRPMFRIGGSVDDGIMSMAAPRKQYSTGGEDIEQRFQRNRGLLRSAVGEGRSQDDRLSELLISGGLNLMSARPGGNIFSTAAGAFKEPTSQFLKSSQEERNFGRQLDLGAATSAITSADAEALARLKLKAENEEAIIKLKGDELKAAGFNPGLARVISSYEKNIKQPVFPIPVNDPADKARGYSAAELSHLKSGNFFVNGKGNLFKRMDNKVVEWDPNTNTAVEPKVTPKKEGFFEKLLTPPQTDKPNPYITSKQRFYEEYYRNNPGKRPQQDMG
jgi:hypothetical protein